MPAIQDVLLVREIRESLVVQAEPKRVTAFVVEIDARETWICAFNLGDTAVPPLSVTADPTVTLKSGPLSLDGALGSRWHFASYQPRDARRWLLFCQGAQGHHGGCRRVASAS